MEYDPEKAYTGPEIDVSDEAFINALEETVEETGRDHVYDMEHKVEVGMCSYVHNGEPDCIIARVLSKLGVPVEWLATQEGTSASGVMRRIGYSGTGPMDYGKLSWAATSAQNFQDNGGTFGGALDLFKRERNI